MKIDVISFIFGSILTLAIVIIAEHLYGKFFGNKIERKLSREVKRLQAVLKKKDELIKKSLHDIQQKEQNDER